VKAIEIEIENHGRVEMYKPHGRALKTVAIVAMFSGSLLAITTTALIATPVLAGASESGVCDSNSSITGGSGQYSPICMSGSTWSGSPPMQIVYGGVSSSGSWTGHIEIKDSTDGYDQNFDPGNHAAGWIQADTGTAIVTGCTTTSVTIWETSDGGINYTNEGTVSGPLVC
jgi:hypothetical protein